MEKTAMQKMIEQLEDKRYKVFGNLAILAFEEAINIAKSLLPEERQQIEDAYGHGFMCDNITPIASDVKSIASDYYNNKYGEK